MVSPSDDPLYELVGKSIVDAHKKLDKLLDRKLESERGITYLRQVNRRLRGELAKQRMYIMQLENELRLRGLE